MNLYHVECPELGCMDMFANDRDEVVELVNIYLAFNGAEHIAYRVNGAIDPMILNRQDRAMLLDAVGRYEHGFGIRDEAGWSIVPVWEYPFPGK